MEKLNIESRKVAYFREASDDGKIALDIYYKISEVDGYNVTILEVCGAGIIIYNTNISRIVVEDKFNHLKMIEITQQDFDDKIIEKLNKKETE